MMADPIPADLAARLNRARIRIRLGPSELALRCDASREHIGDILAGRRVPSRPMARRLIEILELEDELADLLLRHADGRYVSSAGFGIVDVGV